jgi:hypothetical protein
MGDPLGALRTAEVGILLAIALAMFALCARFFPRLKPPSSHGIVALELAFTRDRTSQVLADWTAHGLLAAVRRSIAVDWPFIVIYSSAVAFAGVLAGRAAAGSGLLSQDHADTLAAVLAYAAWAAGLLDCCENIGLLAMLREKVDYRVPPVTGVVSAMKWVLIGLAGFASVGWMVASALA